MMKSPSLAFDTEQEAIASFNKQVTSEASLGDNYKLGIMYLEYAQDKGWDDLEECALKYVRKVEDTQTASVLGDPSEPSASDVVMWTVDELPGPLSKLIVAPDSHKYILPALKGILWGRYGGFVEADLAPIAQQVRPAIDLFFRVQSIMDIGVLKPTDLALKQKKFTPSSDPDNQDKISLYDINMDRNTIQAEERFPFPGYQSIAPVLERRNDGPAHVKRIYKAACKGKSKALQQFKEFRTSINEDFKGTFTADEDAMVAKLPAMMKKIQTKQLPAGKTLYSFFVSFIVRQPEMRPLFERRASRSAMFIFAKGSSLDGYRAKSGANIQELRIGKSLESDAITHVFLPLYMRGFASVLKELREDITFTFVENTAKAIQVGYYDFSTGAQTAIQIVVPDYQSAINRLIDQGKRSMLTHITNID